MIARLAREESAKQGSAAMRVGAVFVDPRVWGFVTFYSCGLTCFFGVNFWIPAIVQELGIARTDYLRVGLVSMIPVERA